MTYEFDLVGKIGSMALIDDTGKDINYNIISRIGKELKPGMIWITSGAVEIGRLDYISRNGAALQGDECDIKTDYAAQGQAILIETYRKFIKSVYSVRQILVEHHHFNDGVKKEHLKKTLLRCPAQNAIPIINYNDAVCSVENMKLELSTLKQKNGRVVSGLDNDETASEIACLVKTKVLLIMTSVDGIYSDPKDKNTLINEIGGSSAYEVIDNISAIQNCCEGASRKGANGAKAKLEYIKEPVKLGTKVIIANSKYSISDILSGSAPATRIGVR
jgi:glutamate 5-kinase